MVFGATIVVNVASENQSISPTGILVTSRVLSDPKHTDLSGAIGAAGAAITFIVTEVEI